VQGPLLTSGATKGHGGRGPTGGGAVEIVIAGGGIVGLSSAMLLARDGHEVVVVERDPAPPADPTAAWDDWEHRGVTQVRMAHHFAPRFRALVERELPDVLDGLVAAGAYRYNPLDLLPAGNGGRKATLTQAPPQLMPQQTDLYKIADQVIKDWNTEDAWGISRINFDGWRYVGFPLPGNYPGEHYGWAANSQWRGDKDRSCHDERQ